MKRSGFRIWLYALALGIPGVLFPAGPPPSARRHTSDSEEKTQRPEPRAKIGNPTPAKRIKYCPGTLRNARYVYVAAYEGDEFNIHLLPEDRDAIVAVQDAIRKWGKLTLVYRPDEADIVLLVESRPSEDILAVYDARQLPSGTYLWRAMGRDGLQAGETPLFTQFEKGFEGVQTKAEKSGHK